MVPAAGGALLRWVHSARRRRRPSYARTPAGTQQGNSLAPARRRSCRAATRSRPPRAAPCPPPQLALSPLFLLKRPRLPLLLPPRPPPQLLWPRLRSLAGRQTARCSAGCPARPSAAARPPCARVSAAVGNGERAGRGQYRSVGLGNHSPACRSSATCPRRNPPSTSASQVAVEAERAGPRGREKGEGTSSSRSRRKPGTSSSADEPPALALSQSAGWPSTQRYSSTSSLGKSSGRHSPSRPCPQQQWRQAGG